MRIIHIITGLNIGGAEMMLYQLARYQHRQNIDIRVVSLLSNGAVKPLIQAEGIDVLDLDFLRGRFSLHGFLKLIQELRRWKPDVVSCWMYHANIIGALVAKAAGNAPVIWGIHNTTLDKQHTSFNTRMIMRMGGILSFIPDKIVYCSENAISVHKAFGYRKDKSIFIPNGFDIERFTPDPEAGLHFREEVNISRECFLVGIIGRYNPQKDFPNFLDAASLVIAQNPNIRFLFCGQGLEKNNQELWELICKNGLADQVYLLGARSDMPVLYQSINLLVSSSAYGEAFPMVIGEAMACGVPCVATDVGDSRSLIGDTGLIVTPRNPRALADAVLTMTALPFEVFQAKKRAARQRIIEHYAIKSVSDQYFRLYERVSSKA